MVYDQEKEIKEAIYAVDTTLSYLNEAKGYLSSASNWGIFDMLGGGFFSTMIKRGKMNDANRCLEKAKRSVINTKKELNDINQTIDVDLEIDGFLSFADYFFDGLVADWMVQSKINSAQKQVDQAIDMLMEIRSTLSSISRF